MIFMIDEKTKLILSESEDIEKILNDELLIEFGKLHNIPNKENLLNLKQEVVAKKGYFLNVKKKYALYITNSGGVEVDEMYLKGLVTQRSDYPSLTKKNINKILEMLLKKDECSFTEIFNFIEKTKKEITDLCIKGDPRVARPVSFSKPLDKYKVIPAHVIGMQFWNMCVYDHFVPGTRGYLFKTRGINEFEAPQKAVENSKKIKSLDCVVLPEEEEYLPKYFNINVDAMVKFAWTDRIEELLKPIWDKIYPNDSKNEEEIAFF